MANVKTKIKEKKTATTELPVSEETSTPASQLDVALQMRQTQKTNSSKSMKRCGIT